MQPTGFKSDTFASATTVDIDLGQACEKAVIMVPTLTTDTYVTVSVSYDNGTTFVTLNRIEGADNQTDVIINSARAQVLELGGVQHIRLTAPATAQTGTVYSRGIR